MSPLPQEGFSLNFGQNVDLSENWCAEFLTQLPRIKVKGTIKGHGIHQLISCPLEISSTLGRIFIKLRSNVDLSETVCRILDSATQRLKVKVTIKGHGV